MFARAWFPGRYFAEDYWPAIGGNQGASYRRRQLREASIDFGRLREMVASLFPGPIAAPTSLPTVEEPIPASVLAYLEALLRPAEVIQQTPRLQVPDPPQTPLQELADSLHTLLDREAVLATLDSDIQVLERQMRKLPRKRPVRQLALPQVAAPEEDEDEIWAMFWLF